MNRAEFMRRLTELLGDVAPTEREEAIQYYNDYFDDAGEENEGSVIASLGTPEELARSIRAGLNDGGDSGEFTEAGFSGYTQMPKDEVIRPEDVENAGKSDDSTPRDGGAEYDGSQSANGYYDGAYYRRPEGDGVYGGRKDTRSYYNPYEQSGPQQNGSTSYEQTKQQKQPMSGGMIVLIVILAVLTSPVWLGLLGALFGIAIGILATLLALFIAFLTVGIVLVAVAVALLVTGIGLLFSAPAAGLCVLGSGLALFGIGILFIWLMIVMAGLAIPACVRGIVSLCRKIFCRGGARA